MTSLENHGNSFKTLFGLPPEKTAPVIVLPVLWDVSTSFLPGAHKAPEAILKVSDQMDLFHPCWQDFKVTMETFCQKQKKQNKKLRKISKKIFQALESKSSLTHTLQKKLQYINLASEKLNQWVYNKSSHYLQQERFVGVLGGDHSSPLGLVTALSEKYKKEGFGILHIDAHADLRENYCGFTHSHASFVNQVLKLPYPPLKIAQIGLRDFSASEYKRIQEDKKLELFSDFDLRRKKSQGQLWHNLCLDILHTLPKNIYISLDVDGLELSCCPDTGTPVPGGLSFSEVIYLLELLAGTHKPFCEKTIIGFDLVEVRPVKHNQVNELVGAKLLFYLCGWIQNQKTN